MTEGLVVSRSLHIRVAAACLVALLVASFTPLPAVADVGIQAIPSFTITGTGWGHGIGLSQWGARGSALAGKDYRWILGHYYSGTTIGGSISTLEPKVNIDSAYRDSTYPGRPYWTVKSVGSPLKVWRTTSGTPSAELPKDTWYRFRNDGTNVIVTTEAGQEVARFDWDVWVMPGGATGVTPLLEFKEKTTSTDGSYHPLDASGWPTNGYTNVRYRGKVWLNRKAGQRLAAINQLSMDQYLFGVVPREMPASWGDATPEALKAQAVAARSYAHAEMHADRTVDPILKCTTYSQVYKGHSYVSGGVVIPLEDSRSNNAVNATSGQYILTGSAVAKGFFFSQSGGHTANNEDVWVSGGALPYLRGVPDPYEHLASPPYSPWPSSRIQTLTGLEIAEKLRGLSGVPTATSVWVTGMIMDRAASGHVRYVTFRFSNGATAKVSGDSVRSRLGLMSTNFTVSGFPIERIEGPDRYATAVATANRAFPGTAPAVVLASGEAFADALTGTGLAGAAGAPLLLTHQSSLTPVTAGALARLAPSTVYVMGGSAAVSTPTVDAVRVLLPSAEVVRVAGDTRYDTAAAAAERVQALSGSTSAIIVNGETWPDAASASALAYGRKMPILLALPDALGEPAETYLSTYTPATTLLVGGTIVVPPNVAEAVGAAAGSVPVRLGGANRYETSAAVARYSLGPTIGFTPRSVYMATGEAYADALTGGSLAGRMLKPLLLTHTNVCPAGTAAFLTEQKTAIEGIYLIGGKAAISEAGAKAIDDVMMR